MNRGFGHCYGHQILTRVPLDSITRHLGRPCHCGRGHQRLRGSCQVTWAHRAAGHFTYSSNMFKSRNEGDRHQFWGDVEILNPQQNPVWDVDYLWRTWLANTGLGGIMSQLLQPQLACLFNGKTIIGLNIFFWLGIPRVFWEICCLNLLFHSSHPQNPATHCILPLRSGYAKVQGRRRSHGAILACAGFTEWAMDGHGAMGPSQKAIENDHL